MRGAGTAATNMCLVASGCVEAYYEIGIHCWDVAAAAVIVSEAGGVLMDVEGWLSCDGCNLNVLNCIMVSYLNINIKYHGQTWALWKYIGVNKSK